MTVPNPVELFLLLISGLNPENSHLQTTWVIDSGSRMSCQFHFSDTEISDDFHFCVNFRLHLKFSFSGLLITWGKN